MEEETRYMARIEYYGSREDRTVVGYSHVEASSVLMTFMWSDGRVLGIPTKDIQLFDQHPMANLSDVSTQN